MYATAGLVIAIPFLVFIFLSILQCSLYSSALVKVRLISRQVSMFAANAIPNEEREVNTKRLAQLLVARSGIGGRLNTMKISDDKIFDEDAISVKLSVSIPILTVVPTIPPFMEVSECASTQLPVNRVCGCIALRPSVGQSASGPSENALYVPIIRPRKAMPVWSPPFDATLNSLRQTQGQNPLPPVCGFNQFYNDGKTLY